MAHDRPEVAQLMRTNTQVPCQPTAVQGIERKVTVESWLRRFTETFQLRSSCCALKASSTCGVSSMAGSKAHAAGQAFFRQGEMVVWSPRPSATWWAWSGTGATWCRAGSRCSRRRDIRDGHIAEQVAGTFMDEQELSPSRRCAQLGHRLVELPDAHLQVWIAHHQFAFQGLVLAVASLFMSSARAGSGRRTRPSRSACACGGTGRSPKKALLADLALIGSLGQPHVAWREAVPRPGAAESSSWPLFPPMP